MQAGIFIKAGEQMVLPIIHELQEIGVKAGLTIPITT